MKEFISAVVDAEADEIRETKIREALEADPTLSRDRAEALVDGDKYVEFNLDGRVLRAYQPLPSQLVFMMAAMGAGQTNDVRFAAIVNIMFQSLRGGDKDYLESRLMTGDKKKTLSPDRLEEIFAFLSEEWFRDESTEGR